jgi:hypothetical protein
VCICNTQDVVQFWTAKSFIFVCTGRRIGICGAVLKPRHRNIRRWLYPWKTRQTSWRLSFI